MAITFREQKEKQKYLTLVFLVAILVIFSVVYFGFLKKEKLPEIVHPAIYQPPKIELNFEILEAPLLKELLPFEEIKPFEGKIGRETPFIPY